MRYRAKRKYIRYGHSNNIVLWACRENDIIDVEHISGSDLVKIINRREDQLGVFNDMFVNINDISEFKDEYLLEIK